MNSTEQKFPPGCFLPLNAIAVHPQGHPHFCLTSTQKPPTSLRAFDQTRKEVHSALIDGAWPESCVRCYNKEKRGLQSRRTRTWERKTRMYGQKKAEEFVLGAERPTIRHLEISFSNVCNLSCAMCSSEFSSAWIGPDAKAESDGLEFRGFTKPYRSIARVSQETLADVLEHVDDFDLIIVKGGEPTREPLCLDFLETVGERTQKTAVFLQSNGTRNPDEWLPRLKKLNLEVGFSFDGWEKQFEWIRGGSFAAVLSHFRKLNESAQVKRLSVDFTLSAFNCFHLPQFLEKIVELKTEVKKLSECPVFQWVQQPYASPLAIRLDDRIDVLNQVVPLLERERRLFLNSENLMKVLALPQLDLEKRMQTQRWFEYLSKLRGETHPDHERIHNAIQ